MTGRPASWPTRGPRSGGGADLRLQAVTLRRDGALVLRELSWTHGPGAIGWVTGENGAGKSTLLRALAGRLRPEAGLISRPAARGGGRPVVAYVHAGMRVPAEATVGDWQALLPALRRATGATWEPPVLAPPGLPPAQRLGRLSTGEARRLLLDAVLRRPADLYLLDEPYAHLSPESKALLTACLRRCAVGAVVVVATNQIVADAAGAGALRLLGEGRWTVAGGT